MVCSLYLASRNCMVHPNIVPINLCGDLLNTTLHREKYYILACRCDVRRGSFLRIEPGTTIHSLPSTAKGGGIPPCIVVHRGAQIFAIGTVDQPITFTALAADVNVDEGYVTDTDAASLVIREWSGKWGGLVIAGAAPSQSIQSHFEALPDLVYGGNDPTDNSGVLRYVRIWHAGAIVSEDNEINSLTLCGVGSGTLVEYVEVAFGLDDGIELFGGNVDLKHISVLFVGDDAIDMDEGYYGRAQFIFVMLGVQGHHAIEMDGCEHGLQTEPTFDGVTLVGSGVCGRGASLVRIRSGGAGSFTNLIATHGAAPVLEMQTCCATRLVDAPPPLRAHGGYGMHTPSFFWAKDNLFDPSFEAMVVADDSCNVTRLHSMRPTTGLSKNFTCLNFTFQRGTYPYLFSPLPSDTGAACLGSTRYFDDHFFDTNTCRGAFPTPGDNWLLGWSWLYPPVAHTPPPPTPQATSVSTSETVLIISLTVASVSLALWLYLFRWLSQRARSRLRVVRKSSIGGPFHKPDRCSEPSTGNSDNFTAAANLSTSRSRASMSGGSSEQGGCSPGPFLNLEKPHARAVYSRFDAVRLGEDLKQVKQLGQGRYSRAVLLRPANAREYVVAKQIWLPGVADDTIALKRMLREVDILSSLKHQHIIRYYSMRSEGEVLSINMEYAAGGTLRDTISACRATGSSTTIPSDQFLIWAAELSCALHFVHAAGVIHRDVKCENVFLTADAQIKLGDFGLSRTISEQDLATTMCGTPYYMAPEQVSRKPYHKSADVWSLGVVLFEVLTLSRPFHAADFRTLAQRILDVQIDEDALALCPHPPEYKRFVTRDALLNFQQEQRMKLPELLNELQCLIRTRCSVGPSSSEAATVQSSSPLHQTAPPVFLGKSQVFNALQRVKKMIAAHADIPSVCEDRHSDLST